MSMLYWILVCLVIYRSVRHFHHDLHYDLYYDCHPERHLDAYHHTECQKAQVSFREPERSPWRLEVSLEVFLAVQSLNVLSPP